MTSRAAYKGTRRRLVLAFDIGTTYSGISYSVLDPGQVPQIKGVTRFPAHEHISGASKIPTIIYYDQQGKVRAVGAEATREGIYEAAEDGNWVKAEWFKLHLRSKVGAGKNIHQNIPPLPPNKTVVDVFADFLRYMLECASSYIQDTHANGPAMWKSVEDDIDFVLSHPNGWEGKEQSQMRRAAVISGLIPDTPAGHARVSFVTEGEASLHFAIQNGVLSAAMKNGDGIVIVDAGGGTIDVSSYNSKTNDATDTYEEIAAPQCHFHGSVFVSIHARVFLEAFLEDSTFVDDLDHIIRCFDKTTKPRFRKADEPQYIKFGSTRDNDPQCNIRFGQLKLAGSDVAEFFEPSVKCIVAAVLDQRKTSHNKISHVVLVGGFAASDWLFNSVFTPLEKLGLNVLRPENHVNKAVSDGAISFYLDHFVRSRVSKVTYGSFCATQYDSTDPEHVARSADILTFNSGTVMVNHYFASILPKNTQVSETKEFRYSFHRESRDRASFNAVASPVWCYRGSIAEPKWKDIDTTNYTQLCDIVTDLSHLPLSPMTNPQGETYYRLYYEIVLLFGLTEMKAQCAWKENGVEKKGPAKIVYDADITRDDP
ncbi:hypothetical protein GALMADRAFT_255630 [Galerina marginata CBS 339.88]|uniref:Uncharacterized protein n=1 Tax=Galerina marginata (strain CBS 339.88) TaxID=685588 RepID=A0A067SQ38_GALM3|nr:hypothetical protein GALMADRAFT_255630 [Galerina marginata CBS 339.88]